MNRHLDSRDREQEVFELILETYIRESKPISSGYLCAKYNLPYSPATIRNTMFNLEKKGLLAHPHTSSGRVPTKEGFKHYVEHLDQDRIITEYPVKVEFYPAAADDINGVIDYTLDTLAEISGYTSLVALSYSSQGSDVEEKLYFRGARFILQQPEFEDIHRLRNLFYALEVKIDRLHDLLFSYLDERIRIFVGDEIGCEEISDCSLVVSGAKEEHQTFSLALLGPMRMDYVKAVSCLSKVREELKKIIEEL